MSLDQDPALSPATDASYQHLQSKYDRLQLLYEVSQQLSSTLSLQQLLQQTLARTTTSTGATRGSIILFDEHGHIQQHLFTRKPQPGVFQDFTNLVVQQGLAGWVLKNDQSALVEDTLTDERWLNYPNEPHEVRSALSVPLMRGRRVRGVLTLVHHEPGFFNQDDLELLNTIAHHAAMAIENARLMADINDERRKFEGAVTAMEEGLILVDGAGRLRYVNPQVLAMFAVASPIPTTLGELSPRLVADLERARATGENMRSELALPGPPRLDLAVHMAYMPILSEEADWWAILLHDITSLKNYDRLKTQFVANASHELRTPLANIKLYATLARQGKPELRTEYLDTIAAEAGRLETLVEDLLTLTRLDSGMLRSYPTSVRIDQMLETIALTYRAMAEARGIALHLEIPAAPLPPTWADPDQLTRIVINLLSNAFKFTASGGTVTLRAYQHYFREPGIAIAVADTGIGIAAEDQKRLFERFYRGSKITVGGSGLGLTIVHELLLLLSGAIEVDSQVGHGSNFICWIPIVAPPDR